MAFASFPTQQSAGAPSASSEAADRKALVLTLTVAFAQDSIYGLFFLSYMNHYLLDVLKTSAGLPAYTLALFGTTKLIMNPVAGRLIDRTSPRLVFRTSVAVQVVAVLLMLAFHTLWSFLIAATLLSAGSAAMWPLIYDVIAHTQEQRGHSRATGLLALVSYLALGSGLVGGVLLGHFVASRVVLLLALAIVGLPVLLQGGAALAPRGRKLAVASGMGGDLPFSQSLSPKSLAAQIGAVATFGLIVFIDYMAVTSIAGLYGPYARLTLHISLLKTALLLSPAGLVALVSLYIASSKSRKGRRLTEMGGLYVLAATGAFVLASTSRPGFAVIGAVILAAGVGGITPIIAASMIEKGGSDNRGLLLGTLMSVEGLGAVLGPAMTGFASDLVSPRAGLALVGILFAMLVPITLVSSQRAAAAEPLGLNP